MFVIAILTILLTISTIFTVQQPMIIDNFSYFSKNNILNIRVKNFKKNSCDFLQYFILHYNIKK